MSHHSYYTECTQGYTPKRGSSSSSRVAFVARSFARSLLRVYAGVLEIPYNLYKEFPGTYQRTSTVPAECPNAPIVWANSIKQLIRAGTSWYELVRGWRIDENRAKTDVRRALSLFIDSIFYSYYFAFCLNALMPCDLPTVQNISFCLVPSGTRVIILHPHVFIEVAHKCHLHSILYVCKWRHDELVCICQVLV